MAPTDARTVAKWFLWRADQDDITRLISNLKLQKLVYYAQAWHLALSGQPLFEDKIEAWVHGPVVPSLYFQYRSSGRNPIVKKVAEEPQLNGDQSEHLQEVWDVYGKYDARYLELLTHQEAPWQIAREGLDDGDPSTQEITRESMIMYYQGLKKKIESHESF